MIRVFCFTSCFGGCGQPFNHSKIINCRIRHHRVARCFCDLSGPAGTVAPTPAPTQAPPSSALIDVDAIEDDDVEEEGKSSLRGADPGHHGCCSRPTILCPILHNNNCQYHVYPRFTCKSREQGYNVTFSITVVEHDEMNAINYVEFWPTRPWGAGG